MEWREANGVEWLEAQMPGARAAFTTRSAGSATESLEPLSAALDLEPERLFTARQVHGAELAFHGTTTGEIEVADGHVMTEPGPAGLVFVADCLPVALRGPGGVAILHCGWRGLAAGIVARGAEAVGATHAVIGPGIGPCCFEVGDEVLAAFAGLGPGVATGRRLDLIEIVRRLGRAAGVEEIEAVALCTSCDEDRFFSYRRDGGPDRQTGLAWIEPGEA
jgi:polyphenol oxidase